MAWERSEIIGLIAALHPIHPVNRALFARFRQGEGIGSGERLGGGAFRLNPEGPDMRRRACPRVCAHACVCVCPKPGFKGTRG